MTNEEKAEVLSRALDWIVSLRQTVVAGGTIPKEHLRETRAALDNARLVVDLELYLRGGDALTERQAHR